MQKLLLAMLIILLVGIACKKGFPQSHAKDDSTAIEGMLEELQQLKESDLEKAFEHSRQIGQRAGKINYQKGVWKARIEQGIVYNALGHTDSSLILIRQVLKETREQNERLLEIKAHLGACRTSICQI